MLLERFDARGDVRYQHQVFRPIEVFEQPADHRRRWSETVVAEIDRLIRLVDLVAEVDQRIVHAELASEFQQLLHRSAGIVVLTQPVITHHHAGFASGPVTTVHPRAELPQPVRRGRVHIVQPWVVRNDDVVRPQAGDGTDLLIDRLRLSVVGYAEADRVVV